MPGLGDPGIDLETGQLPALARLGPLGHFDLQVRGAGQVGTRDAEAAGGHLLDGAVAPVPVAIGPVAVRVLAALTAVALAPDAVHGDRQRFVGFLADGAVRHGAGLEPPDDLVPRFDLFQRNRRSTCLELEQASNEALATVLAVDEFGKFVPGPVVVAAHRLLQPGNGQRRVLVGLTVAAPLVLTAGIQLSLGFMASGCIGVPVPLSDLFGDQVDAGTADPRRRARKIPVDDGFIEADTLEDLGAAVALQG